MKAFSFFSGVGGFEFGLQMAGLELDWVGYSEIDRFASSIYRFHFPFHRNYGDITTISGSDLPDFDLLTGGFPCQAFSNIGKRRGFTDPKGAVFFDLLRIIQEKRPRICLLENVKGLLSHDEGRTFRFIIHALAELGYGLEWQVCNSAFSGVPQDRERVFILGYRGGLPRSPVFPLPKKRPEGPRRGRDLRPVFFPRTSRLRPDIRRMKKPGFAAYTVVASKPHGVTNGRWVRTWSPLESERLQGFPDEWTRFGRKVDGRQFVVSKTQRYKCIGNAVTTTVVTEIGRRFRHRYGLGLWDLTENM